MAQTALNQDNDHTTTGSTVSSLGELAAQHNRILPDKESVIFVLIRSSHNLVVIRECVSN